MTKELTLVDHTVVDSIFEYAGMNFSIEKISQQPGMPCSTTIKRWLARDRSFAQGFIRAKLQHEVQTRDELEEILGKDYENLWDKWKDEGRGLDECKTLLDKVQKHDHFVVNTRIKLLEYDFSQKYTKSVNVNVTDIPAYDMKSVKDQFMAHLHELVAAMTDEDRTKLRSLLDNVPI